MQKTLQQLIIDVERMMYNAAGSAVQAYSQDVIAQKLNQAFDRVFGAKFWPQFLKREVRTLDGVTGKTVTPFTTIMEWGDVHSVFRKNSANPIPTMPESYNLLDLPTSTIPRFIEPSNDTTLFTIYPLTSTGDIVVVGRSRPALMGNYSLADVVPFDYLALEYLAVWECVVDEASNAAMAAKFEALFNSRMKELEDAAFDNIVMLNPRSDQIPTEWR
jgi:hypothetical protein